MEWAEGVAAGAGYPLAAAVVFFLPAIIWRQYRQHWRAIAFASTWGMLAIAMVVISAVTNYPAGIAGAFVSLVGALVMSAFAHGPAGGR